MANSKGAWGVEALWVRGEVCDGRAQFVCECAEGATGLVRHLGLAGGSEGSFRGTDVQARWVSG